MAKATQPRDIVPTHVAALSPSYFDGVPSRAKLEETEDRVLMGLGRHATLGSTPSGASRPWRTSAGRSRTFCACGNFRKQLKMTQTERQKK